MFQENLIYHKSIKGSEAIATRQHGLSPKLRSLLIMIDGKRDFEALGKLSQAPGDTEQLLGQLLEQGFIEPVPAAAPVPATTPAPQPAATISLPQAQRYVVRRLTDTLGPNAETVCLRIEAARNIHDFLAAVTAGEGMVRQFRGASGAADFTRDIQAHMPTATSQS